ncbi:MAG: hypothetical protein HQL01_10970 [Nitrospirae bacterium]|nr:hypothetical protein [Nitrospirota bacterium]
MEISGLSVIAQTNVKSADPQAKQQTYAQPTSQPQSKQRIEPPAKSLNTDESVKVTITNEGKEKLNSSRQNVIDGGGNAAKLKDLARGDSARSEKEADNKNKVSNPAPDNNVISTKAYFSIEKNAKDNKQSVVIKIVDSNGNLIRQIPPGDFFKSASEMNIVPNELYHTLA